MLIRKTFLFVTLWSCSLLMLAQSFTHIAQNSVSVESGGVLWSLYSINYERAIVQQPVWQMRLRAGATERGFCPNVVRKESTFYEREASGLLGVTFLLGRGNSHFETTLLTSLTYHQQWSTIICPMGMDFETYDYSRGEEIIKHRLAFFMGYRYQRPRGGLLFSVGFTPTWQKNYRLVRYLTGKKELTPGYANQWERFNIYPSLSVGWAF